MNLKELHPFRLGDAVKFHDKLNPKLWWSSVMLPGVRTALLKIAEDFVEYLGIDKLNIKDITLSGSNAAYSYTSHSDIDLHIVVDTGNLSPDSVYQELFRDKKQLYNEGRKITVRGIPVECYVQDSSQKHVTLGEYSITNNKWIKFPTKSRANFDQTATKLKYEKLRHIIQRAIKAQDSRLITALLAKIKQYRSAGLERAGEFSPENLAYKAVKSQGTIDKLYRLRDELRGRDLSIESMYVTEARSLDKPTPTVHQIAAKHSVESSEVEKQLKRGIKVEREHTTSSKTAREIALDHLGEEPDYYERLLKAHLEEDNEQNNKYLYHATYRPLLKSIEKHGLGGSGAVAKWEDSEPGVVYLATSPEVAESYAESSEIVPEEWLDEIVILSVPVSMLDATKIHVDRNVQDNSGDTLEYHGVIPFNGIKQLKEQSSITEASGYIPSQEERNDPRWSTALTVDVTPNSIKDNARRLGSKIARDGRPPLLRK